MPLTLNDITNEAKRLLNRRVIGVAQVEDLIYINDSIGHTIVVGATADQLDLPMTEFSRFILEPAIKEASCR